MNREKQPLYRKVNTKTHNVHHHTGSDARHDRNTKQGLSKSMKKDTQRGLDYTPLYKFLLSKVGKDWDQTYSEAVSRLPKGDDAIFHMVVPIGEQPRRRHQSEEIAGYIMAGESSYFSQLMVDENGILQLVRPDLTNEKMTPSCPCCTHTFNGKKFVNKFPTNVSYERITVKIPIEISI